MITLDAIGTFALIVGLLALTPGLDTALILRTAALGHRRRAWGVVLGIQSGTLVWGVLTSLGVTALLTASHLAWQQGFVINLLNPKMGAFYVAVLPQFIPAGASHLAPGVLLAGVHILLAVIWACALIAFAHVLRDRLRRPSARRYLDRITGTVIAAFGIRLALGQ
ncbi:LysE family translocator [Streptomyces syringium]|uniref:LysE family translocator n=1 Tax=Streptomyces syringium TaxID=76729 RepID=UPI003AAC8EC1